MADRRSFLAMMGKVPLLGALVPGAASAAAPKAPDYFKQLGVRPFINAAGTYTTMTASLMPPEVMSAINYASKQFVHLPKLQDAVGARIAELVGVEAAMVTSGAAGALTVGTLACITGSDQAKIRNWPDLSLPPREVIVQKSHRYVYDHAVRACAVKMVEVESADELERAVNERTVMMLFFNDADPRGQIKLEQFVALGKKHKIPTFNDAAADVPPVENLSKYSKMGFDLVTFSGGKGIRGPQSAGLLMGRKDLIDAARLNTSPYSDSFARGMKVNKEEMLGMMVAVERYLKHDHAADRREWDRRAKLIGDAASKVKSVTYEIEVPEIANHVPHVHIKWDQSVVKVSPLDVKKQLADGEPSVEATPSTNKEQLVFGVWMMQPGESEIVARRVQQILKAAAA